MILYGISNDSNTVLEFEDVLKELGLNPSKNFIDKLKQADIRRFPDVFKRLRDKLGYKGTTYNQVNKIIKISQLEGDILGSIDALADSNYRKSKLSKIDKNYMEKIRNFIQELENQKKLSLEKELENLSSSHLCLYKGSAEIFIDYFSNLICVEEKKNILRSIFNCDYNNQEIIDWLDKHEIELVREVGLEPK